jgi:hypothetical protein
MKTYFAEDDFWRKVLRGSTEGPRPSLDTLREAKICDLKEKKIILQHGIKQSCKIAFEFYLFCP